MTLYIALQEATFCTTHYMQWIIIQNVLILLEFAFVSKVHYKMQIVKYLSLFCGMRKYTTSTCDIKEKNLTSKFHPSIHGHLQKCKIHFEQRVSTWNSKNLCEFFSSDRKKEHPYISLKVRTTYYYSSNRTSSFQLCVYCVNEVLARFLDWYPFEFESSRG